MIYEKRFRFSFIGFIFLQILYIDWYLIIQSNSHINYVFYRDLHYKFWYINPYLSFYYDHVKVKVKVSHNRPRWPKGFQVG